MEVDPEKFRKLVEAIFRNFANLEEQLLAFRAVLTVAQQTKPFDPPLLDQWEQVRSDPAIRAEIEKQYAPLRQQLQQAFEDQDLLRFLERWTPTGKPS